MTGEPMHTTSEMTPCPNYRLKSEVSIMLRCQLCSTTQHFESRTVRKAPLQSTHIERKGAVRPGMYHYYHLKSEVSITLRCRLCSTRYTTVRIKNYLKSTSAIKIATMTNTDNFRYVEGKPSRAIAKLTLFTVSKDEWDTKEDTGKSMKNALYVLRYAKRHLSGQSDVKQ